MPSAPHSYPYLTADGELDMPAIERLAAVQALRCSVPLDQLPETDRRRTAGIPPIPYSEAYERELAMKLHVAEQQRDFWRAKEAYLRMSPAEQVVANLHTAVECAERSNLVDFDSLALLKADLAAAEERLVAEQMSEAAE